MTTSSIPQLFLYIPFTLYFIFISFTFIFVCFVRVTLSIYFRSSIRRVQKNFTIGIDKRLQGKTRPGWQWKMYYTEFGIGRGSYLKFHVSGTRNDSHPIAPLLRGENLLFFLFHYLSLAPCCWKLIRLQVRFNSIRETNSLIEWILICLRFSLDEFFCLILMDNKYINDNIKKKQSF